MISRLVEPSRLRSIGLAILVILAGSCASSRPLVEFVEPPGGWARSAEVGQVESLSMRARSLENGNVVVAESLEITGRSEEATNFRRQIPVRRTAPDGTKPIAVILTPVATVDGVAATASVDDEGVISVRIPPGVSSSTVNMTLTYTLERAMDALGEVPIFRLGPTIGLTEVGRLDVQVDGAATLDDCRGQLRCRVTEETQLPLTFEGQNLVEPVAAPWTDPERYTGAASGSVTVRTLQFEDASENVFVQGVSKPGQVKFVAPQSLGVEGESALLTTLNVVLGLATVVPLLVGLVLLRSNRVRCGQVAGGDASEGQDE